MRHLHSRWQTLHSQCLENIIGHIALGEVCQAFESTRWALVSELRSIEQLFQALILTDLQLRHDSYFNVSPLCGDLLIRSFIFYRTEGLDQKKKPHASVTSAFRSLNISLSVERSNAVIIFLCLINTDPFVRTSVSMPMISLLE